MKHSSTSNSCNGDDSKNAEKQSNNNAKKSDKANFDRNNWKRSMGYRRSKSSNAIDTTKKNVRFEQNSNNSFEDCQDDLATDKHKLKTQNRNKSYNDEIIFHDDLTSLEDAFSINKKKSFSLMSLVTRRHHNTSCSDNRKDIAGSNKSIVISDQEKENIQSDEKILTTKLVSSSQRCQKSSSKEEHQVNMHDPNNSVPPLSAKVIRL